MKQVIKTPIIPTKPIFIGSKINLDLKAICIYAATGFFLESDTFYKEEKVLQPGRQYEVWDEQVISQKPYFSWYYAPKYRCLKELVNEFQELFEMILKEQSSGQSVILPLSGGLDSRTQAAGLKRVGAKVNSYSYEFEGGFPETSIGQEIAEVQGFPFERFVVETGYLWNVIDDLASTNGCYSEFTNPRQMAFIQNYDRMGDVFNLGHWGDVLFDDMGVPENLSIEQQVEVILKKIIKKGGQELAEALWHEWGIEGTFMAYLRERVRPLLEEIDIPDSANARIRAFKSLYWAPRWTSVNLIIFEKIKPIHLPYYDNRMCQFICTVPEEFLAGRRLQIEYLKQVAPSLAKITWQDHRPFNLYNYHWNKPPFNLPYRIYHKLKRVTSRRKYIQRNWELQFLGSKNKVLLEMELFGKEEQENFISSKLKRVFYEKFLTVDNVKYAHPISMLLTLNEWKSSQKSTG